MKNPAAGGGRWVNVPPERLVSWIVTFTQRHGPGSVRPDEIGTSVTFTAADGAAAECHPPFPPLLPAGYPDVAAAAEAIAAHAMADRTVGVLLVRLGGYAAGVFAGSPPRLVSSKTGSRPVHGRSAAGGWSQHRFARRRENQAATALRAAADAAARIFAPYDLDALFLGGDKRSAAGVRGDPRLAPYLARATDRFLTVPDPRLAVLREIPSAFLAIRIRLTEPETGSPGVSGSRKLDGVLPTTE
jgi:Actinobacteria/chloroflexi VLRF1 release factor